MKQTYRKLLVLLACLSLVVPAFAHNHDTKKEVTVKVTGLGLGLYELRTDQSGNTLISHGPDGTLIVDTQMEHLVPALQKSIEELTSRPTVDMILNTHLHRDHVRGNAALRRTGVPVIAHPNVHKYMSETRAIKALGRGAPEFDSAYLPNIGVANGSALFVNGHTVRIYHTPAAHTDGDIFVHFEEANVIHTGDLLFADRYPLIDIDNGGTVEGYIAGMKAILEVADKDTAIVAGHGPLSSRETVEASVQMVSEAYALVKKLVEEGLSLEQLKKRAPLSKFSEKWDWAFINTDRMTLILYYDLTGKLK